MSTLDLSDLSTKRYKKIPEILGSSKMVGPLKSDDDFIQAAESGIEADAIRSFAAYFKLTRKSVSDLFSIKSQTLYRWIRNKQFLDEKSAIHLLNLSALFLYGMEVFGQKDKFMLWLEDRNLALGGEKPMQLLNTPEGIDEIAALLARIEHGVYS